MLYASLTDNELRLAIDNAPQDIAIRDEVVKRFLHGKDPVDAYDEGYVDGKKVGHSEGFAEAYDAYADK